MCGRFNLVDPRAIEERFGFFDWHEKRIEPRFNIAPSQEILTLIWSPDGTQIEAQFARWGFAPSGAQPGSPKRPPPINARAESLASSPLFREALAHRRCLIPASGFYEWQTQSDYDRRLPMHIRLKSGKPFAFAGLWTMGHGDVEPSAAIVTCAPNGLMASIHTRMPVILRPEDETVWLDPRVSSADAALAVLRPHPAELMEAYGVSMLVNSVQNEGPALIAPANPIVAQPRLF
jgi:putative SOS response-associated peptidase YedK